MEEKRKGKKYWCVWALCLAAVCLALAGCAQSGKDQQEEYKQQGIAAMASGDYDHALELFQQALDLSGGSVGTQEIDICYYKAAALYRAGRPEEAVAVYDALTEYDEQNADACFLRGSIYAQQRDPEKALEDYRQAVDRDDENYDLYIGIYENLNALGYQEEAAEFGAFIANQGAEQCGFCNPGMIMNALALFRENPDPSEEEIKEYLAGNLCRCSGYEGQLRGIQQFLAYKKEKEGAVCR